MKKIRFAGLALILCCLSLVACSDKPDTQSQPVTIAAITSQGKGFVTGAPMLVRTAYVFFDPQCPHCRRLWKAHMPLTKNVKFVWIPVAFSGDISVREGAQILASPNPMESMDLHEASMDAGTGGIMGDGSADARAAIKANTQLISALGFNEIPAIVSVARDGRVVTHLGEMSTAALSEWLSQ